METAENRSEAIFPKGEPAPAEYFTGKVHLQMLAPKTESWQRDVRARSEKQLAHTSRGTNSHCYQRQRALSGKRKTDQDDQ